MSGSLSKTLETIRAKSTQLIELCESLREKNDLLSLENQSLKVALETSQESRQKLDQKLEALTLAKSVADTEEKSLDIKQKINDFVREIDKCITLLNR